MTLGKEVLVNVVEGIIYGCFRCCVQKPVTGRNRKDGAKDGRSHYTEKQADAINEGRMGRPSKNSNKKRP